MFYVLVFVLSLSSEVITTNITEREPDKTKFLVQEDPIKMSMANRLAALRSVMAAYEIPLAAYIVPTADAHNSEYISEADARRAWLTGFTGSAGTAVVTSDQALVWTDGRYYTQFEKEVKGMWTLMKESLPDTPSIKNWLAKNLNDGDVVGVDPHTMTREDWTPLQTLLNKSNIKLEAVSQNLVDAARLTLNDPPPQRTQNPVFPLELKYTGKKAGQKVKELREKLVEKKCDALVLTALDEVAWTLNLRGSDIEYNPVFFSYLVINHEDVKLFWGDGKLPANVVEHFKTEGLDGISGLPYGEITEYLEARAKELSQMKSGKSTICLSVEASEAICRAASGSNVLKKPLNLLTEVSPAALAKLIKNEVELKGFRECHVKDAVAVIRLFRWLHNEIDSGRAITEIQAAKQLLQYRSEERGFKGPSFETISAAGENGAIIHYSPTEVGAQRVIKSTDMYLLDSGGQYLDGTTDITRTRHMGTPSTEQKNAFTRVLKGQIMLGTALFPQGVKGNVLDSFARYALWEVGLDYAHGTGHGVGHYLNVHEGPCGVSWRPYPHDPGMKPGQILSNEPGFYKVGEYGIRHEDLVETLAITNTSDHPKASNLQGDYDGRGVLGFRTITLVPHQRKCIEVGLLTDFELDYINNYHQRVLETVGPVLKARNLIEDLNWLTEECKPINRADKPKVISKIP